MKRKKHTNLKFRNGINQSIQFFEEQEKKTTTKIHLANANLYIYGIFSMDRNYISLNEMKINLKNEVKTNSNSVEIRSLFKNSF